jgi:hypothetical protein
MTTKLTEHAMPTPAIKTDSRNAAGPWYTHRWPWLIMLGPFLVVLAGSYTIWIAFTRQDALVVSDYYKQGTAINQDLRRDRVATRMGLHADLQFDPAVGRLSGQISGTAGSQTGELTMQLIHPTLPEKDIKFPIQADANGRFSIALPMLEAARWQILIENAKRDWRLDGFWSWPQQHATFIKADIAPAN